MDINKVNRGGIAGLIHSHLVGKADGGVNVLTRQCSAGRGGVTKLDIEGEQQREDGSLGMAHKLEEEGNMLQQNDELAAATGCELGRSPQEDTELGYWQREYPMGVACLTGTTGMEVDKIASGIRDSGDTGYGVKSVAIENGATDKNRTNDAKGIDSKNADNISNGGMIVVNESSVNDNNDKQSMRDSSKSAADCALTSNVLPDADLVFTSASSGIGMSSLLDSDEKQALPLTNFSLHSQRTEVLSEVIDQVVADFSHETKQSCQDISNNVTNGAISGTTKGPINFNCSNTILDSTLAKNVVKPQCIHEDVRQDYVQMQSHYNEDAQLTINVNQDSQLETNSRTHYKEEGNITHNLKRNITLAKTTKVKVNSENMTQMNSQSLPQTQADKITTTNYQTNSQRMLTQQSPFDLNTIGANKMNHAKKLTNNSLDESQELGHQVKMDTNYWATHTNAAHKQQSPLNGITHSNTKQTLRTSQRELDAHGDNTMRKHMFKITSFTKTISRLPIAVLSTRTKQSDQQMHGAESVATATINNMNDQLCDHSTHYNIESETPLGENSMSILKTTTKYLTKRCGEILARTRDKLAVTLRGDKNPTAVTTPFVDAATGNPSSSVQQRNYAADSAQIFGGAIMQRMKHATNHLVRIASGSMREVRLVNTGVNSQKTGIFASLLARAAKFFAAGGIIGRGAIARAASVAVAAMVIFGAGSVVVSVSEAQAQSIDYDSSARGQVSMNVTEPTGNSGETVVTYTFRGVTGPAPEFDSVPISVAVHDSSTARKDVDFTVQETQNVDASSASASNTISVTLKADTFKEGEERIVLTLTLPADSGGTGVEFKQYIDGSAGPENKTITLTFNITDEASDAEIDPIAPAPVLSSQDHIMEFPGRGNNDTLAGHITTFSEPTAAGEKTRAHLTFGRITNPVSADYSAVPVTVSVIEGPTDAVLGEDFTIPANQTLDFSTPNAENQIVIEYLGDNVNEDTVENILVWISLPDDLPVHFRSDNAGATTLLKAFRVRFDINDDNTDSGAVPTAPVTSRSIMLETTSAGGFFGGDIPYTITVTPPPVTPVSIPLYVWDTSGNANGLTLPGTFASRAPVGAAGEPQDVFYLPVGITGKATGVISVPNSGATGSARLFIQQSITGYTLSTDDPFIAYTIVPDTRFLSIPIAQAPGTVPVISISGPTSSVNEGDEAVFTLTPTSPATADTTIAVNVVDFAGRTGADYVTDGLMYTVLKANATDATLRVQTNYDNAEGVDGLLMATIASGTGYTIKSDANVAYANVLEASTTVTPSTVTITTTPTSVEEGNTATFTISRGSDDTGNLEVGYILVDTGDVITGEGTDLITTILDGQSTRDVTVDFKTSSEDYEAGDGVELIIRSIQQFAGARYRVGATDRVKIGVTNSATQAKTLAISTAYTTVLPASSLYFTIMAEPAPTGSDTITVPVTATDGDSNVLSISPSSLVINNTGSVQGRVTTVAGNLSDLGDLTVTLGAVAGYSLSPATITVPFTTVGTTARVSIAGPASVNEGGTATFTLSADPAADVDTTVQVNVFDPTARGYVTFAQRYIYLPANATTATFDVVTNDVSSAGADGAIAATVQAGAGYTGVTTTALVDVYDEDGTAVEVSVAATPASVEAGTDATFTFTRTGDTTNALTFSYELIETGEVTTESEGNVDDAEFAAGESTEVITVTTAGTTFNSGDGITLRLRSAKEFASATYRVVDPVSAKVGVTEAAAVPEITIAGPGGVTQGYDFTFTVTSNIAITAPSGLAVAVKLDDFAFSDG